MMKAGHWRPASKGKMVHTSVVSMNVPMANGIEVMLSQAPLS